MTSLFPWLSEACGLRWQQQRRFHSLSDEAGYLACVILFNIQQCVSVVALTWGPLLFPWLSEAWGLRWQQQKRFHSLSDEARRWNSVLWAISLSSDIVFVAYLCHHMWLSESNWREGLCDDLFPVVSENCLRAATMRRHIPLCLKLAA